MNRVIAIATLAVAAFAAAPASASIFGPCDDHHDIEVHIANGQCVQADYPR